MFALPTKRNGKRISQNEKTVYVLVNTIHFIRTAHNSKEIFPLSLVTSTSQGVKMLYISTLWSNMSFAKRIFQNFPGGNRLNNSEFFLESCSGLA